MMPPSLSAVFMSSKYSISNKDIAGPTRNKYINSNLNILKQTNKPQSEVIAFEEIKHASKDIWLHSFVFNFIRLVSK